MSNLTWLREEAYAKGQELRELSDEFWEVILNGIDTAPQELEEHPGSLGKNGVISTLGMMMYFPNKAGMYADMFGAESEIETGVLQNIDNSDLYISTVAQGISAAESIIEQWVSEVEDQPRIGATSTTDDLKTFLPFFEERISDLIEEVELSDSEKEDSLLTSLESMTNSQNLEGNENG